VALPFSEVWTETSSVRASPLHSSKFFRLITNSLKLPSPGSLRLTGSPEERLSPKVAGCPVVDFLCPFPESFFFSGHLYRIQPPFLGFFLKFTSFSASLALVRLLYPLTTVYSAQAACSISDSLLFCAIVGALIATFPFDQFPTPATSPFFPPVIIV